MELPPLTISCLFNYKRRSKKNSEKCRSGYVSSMLRYTGMNKGLGPRPLVEPWIDRWEFSFTRRLRHRVYQRDDIPKRGILGVRK